MAKPRTVAPREADASTREKILGAALTVFAEKGFDGARTREIAERAEANLGLIKYYFDTKEKLWKAAVDRAFDELQQELAELDYQTPDDDERAQLERLVHRFVRFVARRPEFVRLMNDEGKRDGPRMRWLVEQHLRPAFETLRPLLARVQRGGGGPPISPVSLHYMLMGAAGLVFSQAPECARSTGVDPTDEAFVEAHAQAVVRFMMGAVAQ